MCISAPQVPLSGLASGNGMRLELSQDGQEILLRIPIAVLSGNICCLLAGYKRSPHPARLVFGGLNLQTFTSREREVFEHLRAGKVNKEIASATNISVRTVKFHLSHIYRKLRVHSRLEAVRLCG
jgi:DNA-binding NarL/FixJ family response regulator